MESRRTLSLPADALLWTHYVAEYVPGFAVLLLLSLLARVLATQWVGTSHVLLALLLGFVYRNTLGVGERLEPGTRVYEIFLKVGVILLGTSLTLGSYRNFGARGVALVPLTTLFGLTAVRWLLGALGAGPKLSRLLAIGFGVGTSGMLGLARHEEASDAETSYALCTLLLFGLLANLVFPAAGTHLGLSDLSFGLWAALAINNTGLALSASMIFSPGAAHYTALARICRNALLGVGLLHLSGGSRTAARPGGLVGQARFIWEKFPKFLLGFFVFSLLASLGWFTPRDFDSLNNIAQWAFLLTFTGIGLRTSLAGLRRSGARRLVVGFCLQAGMAAVLLMLLLRLHAWGWLD